MTMSTSELKEQQLASCKSATKIAIVILNSVEDPVAKATMYLTQCTHIDENGDVHEVENKYRYSQLLDFNEKLMHKYGPIRLLRLFPPKKLMGNREGDFVQKRLDSIQSWMSEIVEDEELCDDKEIREFFKLN